MKHTLYFPLPPGSDDEVITIDATISVDRGEAGSVAVPPTITIEHLTFWVDGELMRKADITDDLREEATDEARRRAEQWYQESIAS